MVQGPAGQHKVRVRPEAPRRRGAGAPFGQRREARGPAQRLGAPRPTLDKVHRELLAEPRFAGCQHFAFKEYKDALRSTRTFGAIQ